MTDQMGSAGAPGWETYCSVPGIYGPFENRILYEMCRDHPGHDHAEVTAGKITAIGRIYAATPERGAGTARAPDVTLADALGRYLAKCDLDDQ